MVEARSREGLLEMLKGQGLIVEDEARALQILSNVSYSRLKNYLIPLMQERSTHKFKPGATFEQAYTLYGFDRRLRELIFHEMEKVEISIRTRMAYCTNGAESGYWYLNPDHFKSPKRHNFMIKRLLQEMQRTDNENIQHFYSKYRNEFPPCWLAFEATSMGTMAVIYDEMAPGELKDSIAASYGLSAHDFSSWVHHLVYMRNNCAHHNRVWDKKVTVKASIPSRTDFLFPRVTEDAPAHIYYTFCVLRYFQNNIKPTNSFALRLKMLIGNFPLVDDKLMGFPSGWKENPFWK